MADIAVTYNAQQDKTETIERFRESSPQMFRYKEIYSFQTGFMDRIVFLRIWVPIDTEHCWYIEPRNREKSLN